MTGAQKERLKGLLNASGCSEAHHGDCVGADEQFHDILTEGLGWTIVIHPSSSDALRAYKGEGEFDTIILPPKPPLQRNHDIVDASDLMIACPNEREEILRSGTWATIRYARERHKPLIVILPDGTNLQSGRKR
jgi:hypothetical protein